jgi:hypothetical protein
MNIILFVLLLFVLAFFFAQLEIQIEGSAGWAKNLPTWRKSLRDIPILRHLFFKDMELTGYHLYLNLFIFSVLHIVYIWAPFDVATELELLSFFTFFFILEDFLWFLLNPHFGLKKFKKENIPWHQPWVLGLPGGYFFYGFIGVVFLVVSSQI